MKIARLNIRVSSSQQDLERQNQIYTDAIMWLVFYEEKFRTTS